VLPPLAGSTLYELTDLGQGLEPAVLELGRWGAHFLGEPRSRDSLQPSWFLVSIRASFRPEHSAELDESYEFRIGVEAFHVVVRARAADDRPGCGRFPDVVVSTDLETFVALLAQQLTPVDALADGAVEVDGDPAALSRFVDILRLANSGERRLTHSVIEGGLYLVHRLEGQLGGAQSRASRSSATTLPTSATPRTPSTTTARRTSGRSKEATPGGGERLMVRCTEVFAAPATPSAVRGSTPGTARTGRPFGRRG
jgi:hypothetical protein